MAEEVKRIAQAGKCFNFNLVNIMTPLDEPCRHDLKKKDQIPDFLRWYNIDIFYEPVLRPLIKDNRIYWQTKRVTLTTTNHEFHIQQVKKMLIAVYLSWENDLEHFS